MRLSALSAVAAAFVLLSPAVALAADQLIVVVDTNKLWNETSVGKDVQSQLKSLQTRIETSLKSNEETLQKDAAALKAKKDSLQITEAAFNQEVMGFRQREAEHQRRIQEESQHMAYANQVAQRQFYSAVEPILIQLVKEKKGALLLEANQILYFTPDYDITSQAIGRLEKTVKTLKVELEPKVEGPPAPAAGAKPAADPKKPAAKTN